MIHDSENMKISKNDMIAIADHIEEYLDMLTDVFIIPEALIDSEQKIYDAMATTRKLIKKLRDGNLNVFNDPEDWELTEVF